MNKISLYKDAKKTPNCIFVTYIDDAERKHNSLQTADNDMADSLIAQLKEMISDGTIYNYASYKQRLEILLESKGLRKPGGNSDSIPKDSVVLTENALKSSIAIRCETSKESLHQLESFNKEMESYGLKLNQISSEIHKNQDGEEFCAKILAQYRIGIYKSIDRTPKKVTVNISKDKIAKYLVISDFHVPYHNEKLIYTVLQMALDLNFHGLIINGDVMDFDFISSFTRTPDLMNANSINDSIKKAGDIFNFIENSKFKERWLIEGNHDQRICRNILGESISGSGIKQYNSKFDFYSLATLLDLSHDLWEFRRYGERIQIGNLFIHHGEEYGQNANVAMIRENNLYGHTHRPQMSYGYRVKDDGKREFLIECRTGSMIDKYSDIPAGNKKMINAWNNGFAVVNVVNDKSFVENIVVQDDHFYYNNNIYTY